MIIDVLTLFPSMFSGPFSESIIKRAIERGLVKINLVNIRDFGLGRHKVVDDKPYGGGVGMIMRVDVIVAAIESVLGSPNIKPKRKIVLLDPRGRAYTQEMAREFSQLDHLILVCGHYEGVDERVKKFVDLSVSIGDYILTGGEIPAMVIVDSVVRLIPGVLPKPEATRFESFSNLASQGDALRGWQGLFLEYPQYTRPEEFRGLKVPSILLSGDHKKIEEWRKSQIKLVKKKKR